METIFDVAPAKTGTKPAKVFKDRGVTISVFPNHATVKDRDVTFFNSLIERTYKNGMEFKRAYSFGKDDLLRVQQLVGHAYAWIVNEEAAARKEKQAK